MSVLAWDNYRHVFAPAGARALAAAGMMSRASVSTVGLGILQLISATHGGYGLAGVVCGTYMVCAALGGLFWARATDFRGQRWVLHRTAVFLAVGAFGDLLFAASDASWLNLLTAAAITGAGIPPAGAMIRARWTVVHADTPTMGVAYSMESSLEEVLFMVGPPVMGFLDMVNSYIGLPLVVSITLTGMLWLAAQPGTEPPIDIFAPRQQDLLIRVRGMPVLFAASFSFGGMLGALDIAVIAFAANEGHEQVGLIGLALWAATSAIGGMIFGAMRQTVATDRRFVIVVTIVWVAVLPLAVVRNLGQLTVLLAIGGTFMAPAMAVVTGLAEQISPRKSLTLALAWISTGTGLGAAAGTMIQGWVGGRGFLVPVGFASVAAAVAWRGASSLRYSRPPELPSTPWSGKAAGPRSLPGSSAMNRYPTSARNGAPKRGRHRLDRL
ncbi:MFS transporter [Nocardia sp. NPDC059091]|uniref:MFS transporter n=1 Tax=unclassified Nocardia TaxID=2637762 RepID=UPI0036984655